MKMREEIDALRTMGLDPVEVLMLPRIVALVCAMPILTFFWLHVRPLRRRSGGLALWRNEPPDLYCPPQGSGHGDAFRGRHDQIAIYALVIGLVACSEGLQVAGSAESLGLKTTASVVKSIFLVIVMDGFFAIFFASIGM